MAGLGLWSALLCDVLAVGMFSSVCYVSALLSWPQAFIIYWW